MIRMKFALGVWAVAAGLITGILGPVAGWTPESALAACVLAFPIAWLAHTITGKTKGPS